jgi:hypothetical protein
MPTRGDSMAADALIGKPAKKEKSNFIGAMGNFSIQVRRLAAPALTSGTRAAAPLNRMCAPAQ